MSKISVGLIGYGAWGRNLARCFHQLGVLGAVCDIRSETLEEVKSHYPNVATFPDSSQLLRQGQINAVAVATEPSSHFMLAKQALLAGKDVFVEKPLCLSVAEAEELVHVAEANGLILMVGHVLQYHPCVLKLYELVAEGSLGKLYYITSHRLNLGTVRREENALWSFAPHDISVILRLVGNHLPEQVQCFGGAYINHGIADTTLTYMKFPGDIRAHVYVSWLNPFKEQKLIVIGSHGMAVFDDTADWEDKLVLFRDYLIWSEGRVPLARKDIGQTISVERKEPLLAECEHFVECCIKRLSPRTDGREAVRVLKVLELAQKSLEETEGLGQLQSCLNKRSFYAHPTAIIDEGAKIGAGTKIWHFTHVSSDAEIGSGCVLGQNVYIGPGVRIGNNVKIQNNVSVYSGVEIEDDVFLGPSCVFTNVLNPRSEINRHGLFERTLVRKGATIGANATVICGITIGRYAFVAAGAVVTRDVPDYGLVAGVPAKLVGWMSRHGHRLEPGADGLMKCPESGWRYKEVGPGLVRCLDFDEEMPLPPDHRTGKIRYRRGVGKQ